MKRSLLYWLIVITLLLLVALAAIIYTYFNLYQGVDLSTIKRPEFVSLENALTVSLFISAILFFVSVGGLVAAFYYASAYPGHHPGYWA